MQNQFNYTRLSRFNILLLTCVFSLSIGCSSSDSSDMESSDMDSSGGQISGGQISGGQISGGQISGGQISGGQISGGQISGGSLMPSSLPVSITVRVINGATGQGVAGMFATVEQGKDESNQNNVILEGMTSVQGEVTLQVLSNQFYHILMTAPGYDDHVLYGYAGDQDFTQITFASAQSLTNQVFSLVNITPSPDKAIIVVGLDRANLAPALGAQAAIMPMSGSGFTLVNSFPTLGTTLTEGALGFVFFANVDPGEITLSALALEGETCAVFPANQESDIQVDVQAGQVVIAAFTCE
jgi:hypothetical protein